VGRAAATEGGVRVNEARIAKCVSVWAKRLLARKSTTTIKESTLKDGTVIPKGARVQVDFSEKYPYFLTLDIEGLGRTLSLNPSGAYKKLRGFTKPPSVRTMEKWSNDAIAKTITGKRTEPDGFGPDGSPSWMLVMGVI